MSLSSRRAWIEIYNYIYTNIHRRSLSSRRAWIEIRGLTLKPASTTRRSPHGERGLKCRLRYCNPRILPPSLSSRRAWIEIKGAYHRLFIQHKSLSSRRAWIEIIALGTNLPGICVALLTESVD